MQNLSRSTKFNFLTKIANDEALVTSCKQVQCVPSNMGWKICMLFQTERFKEQKKLFEFASFDESTWKLKSPEIISSDGNETEVS